MSASHVIYIFNNLPKTDVCFDRNRICNPIRPYSITITAIGTAKNINDDSSHSGKPGGLSSIAQNAESNIVELSERIIKQKNPNSNVEMLKIVQ